MGRPHGLPLLGLLLLSLPPNQLCQPCEVSEENYFRLNPLLKTMTDSKYTTGTQSAEALLSLRLVGIQNRTLTQTLSQQVKKYVGRRGFNLSSGQLALVTLALGACHTPDEAFLRGHRLLRHLQGKFQEEIENMRTHSGTPLTNYYQLSLSVLALCLFHGRYSPTQVAGLFAPENKNYYFRGHFVVDTGAVAVLALTCVKRGLLSGKTERHEEDLRSIDNHIRSLVKKILSEKKQNGLLGNTFSTGAAMQALLVSPDCYEDSEWDCRQTRDAVLKEISQGAFDTPAAAAQILPALVAKTYLDANKSSCTSGLGNINISSHEPESTTSPNSPLSISVHYSVKINEIYSITVTVPSGSVFLDVMEEAQRKNKTIFRFTVEQSSWGPYVTSVQGLEANNNDRTYWELLSEGTPLSRGVGNYVVHNGENLEVRWSKY